MLASFYGVIEVKHYHQGRLRIQTDVLRDNEEGRQHFLMTMAKIEGVLEAKVNTLTGTALILFREEIVEANLLYLSIIHVLGLEEEAFRKKPGKIKLLLQNVGDAIDFAIYNKSKGLLDARSTTAFAFLFYGLVKLKQMPQMPAGATLLWWSYNLINKGK